MRYAAALLAALVLGSCAAGPPPAQTAPIADLVIPAIVPNGKVEVVVKNRYAVGETVRATVRLRPASGTLRGPIDPFIQASGFHGTATVRHLSVEPVSATADGAEAVVLWDMHDDAGQAVGSDDYSLVFNVADDSGRTTVVGATLQVR
jgi:hypothetical protein